MTELRSVSDNSLSSEREKVTITGKRANRDRFLWNVTSGTGMNIGTTVAAYNEAQRTLSSLDADNVLAVLLTHFAPAMLNDPSINIVYDSTKLDPNSAIIFDTDLEFAFGDEDRNSASLRIIEWGTAKHRSIHFGPDTEHFPFETSAKDIDRANGFSAYVTWSGLDDSRIALLGLRDQALEEVGELWSAAENLIRVSMPIEFGAIFAD